MHVLARCHHLHQGVPGAHTPAWWPVPHTWMVPSEAAGSRAGWPGSQRTLTFILLFSFLPVVMFPTSPFSLSPCFRAPFGMWAGPGTGAPSAGPRVGRAPAGVSPGWVLRRDWCLAGSLSLSSPRSSLPCFPSLPTSLLSCRHLGAPPVVPGPPKATAGPPGVPCSVPETPLPQSNSGGTGSAPIRQGAGTPGCARSSRPNGRGAGAGMAWRSQEEGEEPGGQVRPSPGRALC